MSYYQKVKRQLLSAYYETRGKTTHYADGVYGNKSVPHYSERCGWKKFGASNEKEYEYWWQEACGIVSLRMILDTLNPESSLRQESIFEQIQNAINDSAYLQRTIDGKTVRIGWIHAKLVNLARKRGVQGHSLQLSIPGICYAIASDELVMASVYRPFSRFIDENAPRKKAGGHLVVITGFEWHDGRCTGLYVADPYDTTPRKTPIEPSLFDDIYSGSVITFHA
jgi:hypothetical protein